ncbi:uncharacterized protein LOC134178006 [Corticium candelabrum]|uniref:uncharacterized protein LOC134178006 n=1 Tax=Corticium candelabrum TaxID=121492 RepID=UPI002E26D676|nr:uncharacterized protein LOC134178006 [Corticium candelabrum]
MATGWTYHHDHYCHWIVTCSANSTVYVKSNLYPNSDRVEVNACATSTTHGDYVKVKVGYTTDDTICDKGPSQGYYYERTDSNAAVVEFNSDSSHSNKAGMFVMVHDMMFGTKRKRESDGSLADNNIQLNRVEEMLVDIGINENARFYCDKDWARPFVDHGCTCDGIDVETTE